MEKVHYYSYIRTEGYKRNIFFLDQLLQIDPNDVDVLNYKGLVYRYNIK